MERRRTVEDDADPRYGNEFHYRLLSLSLFFMRAHTRIYNAKGTRGTALLLLLPRHPCNWLAPFLSRWYLGGRQRGHRESGWTTPAASVVCRRWARGMPRMMPRSYDSNYYRYRVRNFNPFNKSRSRRCTHSWIVVAAGRARQLYANWTLASLIVYTDRPAVYRRHSLCIFFRPRPRPRPRSRSTSLFYLSAPFIYIPFRSICSRQIFFPRRSQPIIEDIDLLVFEKKNFLITIRIIYCAVCTRDGYVIVSYRVYIYIYMNIIHSFLPFIQTVNKR